MNLITEKKIAAVLSITSNTLVFLFKIVAGVLSGSISIISEAIHSVSDFLASVLTFFAVTRSSEPADKEHPFGHGKYEDMSGFIEGGLIILAGIYIIYEASKKLIYGYELKSEPFLGIIAMAFAVIANLLVSQYLFYVAKKSDSVSLKADGEHLRTDIYSSLGVLVGLILIKVTGMTILDPIIAIIVALFIFKAGFEISKETLNNLLDSSLPDDEIDVIENILKNNQVIKGYKNIKARKSGQYKRIEITLLFNEDMKIKCCHSVCDQIENEIKSKLPNSTIVIHAEPEVTNLNNTLEKC